MKRTPLLGTMLGLLLATHVGVSAEVAVPGSSIRFEDTISASVAGNQESLVLTGTALREKFFVNVYALGSYVKSGTDVKNAEDLAGADVPKQLILVLERDLPGSKMASAVKDSITANYSASEFKDELNAFLDFIKSDPLAKGDRVVITHRPGVGIDCQIVGKKAIQIESMKFSRAVWDIYFGKRNIGVAIKRSLTSRL